MGKKMQRFTYKSRAIQTIDVFRPTSQQQQHQRINCPVMLLVHGGAWCIGNSQSMYTIAHTLSNHGFVCAVPSYGLTKLSFIVMIRVIVSLLAVFCCLSVYFTRVASRVCAAVAVMLLLLYHGVTCLAATESNDIKHPDHILDVVHAVKWCKDNLQEITPECNVRDKFFVLGHSAGGHLVSLLSVTDFWLHHVNLSRDDIAGCIAISAPMSRYRINWIVEQMLRRSIFIEHDPEKADKLWQEVFAWPLTAFAYETAHLTPPICMLVAETDLPGICEANADFAALLKEYGIFYHHAVCYDNTHWTIRRFWNTAINYRVFLKVVDFCDSVCAL